MAKCKAGRTTGALIEPWFPDEFLDFVELSRSVFLESFDMVDHNPPAHFNIKHPNQGRYISKSLGQNITIGVPIECHFRKPLWIIVECVKDRNQGVVDKGIAPSFSAAASQSLEKTISRPFAIYSAAVRRRAIISFSRVICSGPSGRSDNHDNSYGIGSPFDRVFHATPCDSSLLSVPVISQ